MTTSERTVVGDARPATPPAGALTATLAKPVRRDRRWWAITITVVVSWSVLRAGVDIDELVNERGLGQVREFFGAMFAPDLSADMLELVVRESGTTAGYALLGTAVGVALGLLGGVVLTERVWRRQDGPMGTGGRIGWSAAKVAFALPRSMHEVVFGLVLVNVLGLDPLVAVLAIGVPFGAVMAKVFAELLDDISLAAEQQLRATGAGRITALLVATVPQASGDIVSYAFYRLECALRSAAVLGIIGAGGLGFQLALSFQTLKYDQMWTVLWALILLSWLADTWSSAVRRRRDSLAAETRIAVRGSRAGRRPTAADDRLLRLSALACIAAIPLAWLHLDIDPSTLWAPRARALARELAVDAWPPALGPGGWSRLVSDSVETVGLGILSTAIAFVVAAPLAFLAQRPSPGRGAGWLARAGLSALVRFVMLVARSVPPPVWAFVVVFVLFPGMWPGAVALAIYQVGVLARLQGEVLENTDPRPGELLRAAGASRPGALTVATVPMVASRFAALGLYRWEVGIRETVIVGIVGAAGLGRRLDQQTAAFDYDGLLASVGALFVVTIAVDFVSAAIRQSLR